MINRTEILLKAKRPSPRFLARREQLAPPGATSD
jgi:hypothetical protein